jgi:hypothetical protein
MPADPVSLSALALALVLAALFTLAAAYDFRTFRRRESKRKAVYRCDGCRHIYVNPQRTPLARCPRCGQQNEPVRE